MKLLLPDAAVSAQPEALSPLEAQLRGAGAVQLHEQTLAQLKALEQRARAGISAGVLPQRYRELAALVDACAAAQEVLECCTSSLSESAAQAPLRMACEARSRQSFY